MFQILANGLCISAVYVVLALGFGLIYFTTKNFHIAHGAVYTLGAYVGYQVMVNWSGPIWLAALAVICVCAASGCIMEILIYKPLVKRKSPPEVVMIASLGTYILAVNLLALVAGNDAKVLRFEVERTYMFGSARLTAVQLAQVVVALLVVLLLRLVLTKSLAGKYWRAVADNQVLGSVLGFRVSRIRLGVFAAGSALAGLAGFLRALDVGMTPYVGMQAVVTSAVACILGGLGLFLAPIGGALVVGLLQGVVMWYASAAWESAVTFWLLILFLVFRPQGFFGLKRRLEEA